MVVKMSPRSMISFFFPQALKIVSLAGQRSPLAVHTLEGNSREKSYCPEIIIYSRAFKSHSIMLWLTWFKWKFFVHQQEINWPCVASSLQGKRENNKGAVSVTVLCTLEMCRTGVPSWEISFCLGHFSGVCYPSASNNGWEQSLTWAVVLRPEGSYCFSAGIKALAHDGRLFCREIGFYRSVRMNPGSSQGCGQERDKEMTAGWQKTEDRNILSW